MGHDSWPTGLNPALIYKDDTDDEDKYPCKVCGQVYSEHDYLLDHEIAEAKSLGYIVTICETGEERGAGPGSTSFTFIVRPPENPCDVDYMEGVSS